jgi:AcrR family transcriptional regulator
MSSDATHTRDRLLEAARRLFEERGPHGAGMDEIAKAAGVSRQSAYLHFGSKGGLLLALVAYVDAQRDVNERVEEIWAEPNALSALATIGGLAAKTNAEVHRLAIALDSARHWDEAFDKAWQDRMLRRLARYRRLAQWLKKEGSLGAGWTVRDAAAYIWSVTSAQTYDQLVVDRGLSIGTYARILDVSLVSTLTAPIARD